MNLSQIKELNPRIIDELNQAGYDSVEKLALADYVDLIDILDPYLDLEDIILLIESAKRSIDFEIVTCKKYMEEIEIERITTGSNSLDELLGGGIETKGITEFYGGFATGKTQIAHQLCVNVQLPPNKGLEAIALVIDTENTFRPDRIKQMVTRYKKIISPEKVLENILFVRPRDSDHQILIIEKISNNIIQEKNIRLIVLDSLTNYFRQEYSELRKIVQRQQKLNRHIAGLQRLARKFNVAVVVTNQILEKPTGLMDKKVIKHVGGNIVAHGCTTRVFLRKGNGSKRIARLVDSPYLPERDLIFSIDETGITD